MSDASQKRCCRKTLLRSVAQRTPSPGTWRRGDALLLIPVGRYAHGRVAHGRAGWIASVRVGVGVGVRIAGRVVAHRLDGGRKRTGREKVRVPPLLGSGWGAGGVNCGGRPGSGPPSTAVACGGAGQEVRTAATAQLLCAAGWGEHGASSTAAAVVAVRRHNSRRRAAAAANGAEGVVRLAADRAALFVAAAPEQPGRRLAGVQQQMPPALSTAARSNFLMVRGAFFARSGRSSPYRPGGLSRPKSRKL